MSPHDPVARRNSLTLQRIPSQFNKYHQEAHGKGGTPKVRYSTGTKNTKKRRKDESRQKRRENTGLTGRAATQWKRDGLEEDPHLSSLSMMVRCSHVYPSIKDAPCSRLLLEYSAREHTKTRFQRKNTKYMEGTAWAKGFPGSLLLHASIETPRVSPSTTTPKRHATTRRPPRLTPKHASRNGSRSSYTRGRLEGPSLRRTTTAGLKRYRRAPIETAVAPPPPTTPTASKHCTKQKHELLNRTKRNKTKLKK